MIFSIITLIVALALAGTAAGFAIFGIMAIFAGLPVHAMIMGIVIELGKIVGVSWVYRHWEDKTILKYVLIPPIILAMALTSMGIFGLLSAAHLEQTAGAGSNAVIIERLDQQIGRAEQDIARAENALRQLDTAVDEFIDRGFVTRGLEARAEQQSERDQIASLIQEREAAIAAWSDQRMELNQELQALALEVGPIRYIAAIVYGDEDDLEAAVRWAIIAFIFVFDPMAILLLMAANYSFMQRGIHLERKPPVVMVSPPPEPDPEPEFPDREQVDIAPVEEDEPKPVEEPEQDEELDEAKPAQAEAEEEPEFVGVDIIHDETPESFVERLIIKHEDPSEWFHSEQNELVSNQGVIARNISRDDARVIIDMAHKVMSDEYEEVKMGNVGDRYGIVLRRLKNKKDS